MVCSLSQGRDCRRQQNSEYWKNIEWNSPTLLWNNNWSVLGLKGKNHSCWSVASGFKPDGGCEDSAAQTYAEALSDARGIGLWQKVGRRLLQDVFLTPLRTEPRAVLLLRRSATDAAEGIWWMTTEDQWGNRKGRKCWQEFQGASSLGTV